MPTTPIFDPEELARQWSSFWHAQSTPFAPSHSVFYGAMTRVWMDRAGQAMAAGIQSAAAKQVDAATVASAKEIFARYADDFVNLLIQLETALLPPEQAHKIPTGDHRVAWRTGRFSTPGRQGPSTRYRLRAVLEHTTGLAVAKFHKFTGLKQASDKLAQITRIPFSGSPEDLNRFMGCTDQNLFAWEDGRLVSLRSPEAEWYWSNDRNEWRKTAVEGKVSGGESGCGESFDKRINACQWFGWDACNVGSVIQEKIGGYTKGGGNFITGIMSAWSASTASCVNNLKIEIIWKRNAWCFSNNVVPPTYPEVGSLGNLIPNQLPDLIAEQYVRFWGVPGGNAPASSGSSAGGLLAAAAAGFVVGGPVGAGVGAVLALAISNQKK